MVWLSSCNNEKMQKEKKRCEDNRHSLFSIAKAIDIIMEKWPKAKRSSFGQDGREELWTVTERCRLKRYVYTVALAHSLVIARVLIGYCSCCRDVNVHASSLLG